MSIASIGIINIYVDSNMRYINYNITLSIENIGNWLGSRWGGFPPWDRGRRADRRTEHSKSDLTRQKLRKGFIYRAFGGSGVALMMDKRPFFPFWEFMVHYRHYVGLLSRRRRGTDGEGWTAAL